MARKKTTSAGSVTTATSPEAPTVELETLPDTYDPKQDKRHAKPMYGLGFIRPDNQWIPISVTLQAARFQDIFSLLGQSPPVQPEKVTVIVRLAPEGDGIVYYWDTEQRLWIRYRSGQPTPFPPL